MLNGAGSSAFEVRAEVEVDDAMDLAFWSLLLDVEPQQLRKAVDAVGTELFAVSQHLRVTRERR